MPRPSVRAIPTRATGEVVHKRPSNVDTRSRRLVADYLDLLDRCGLDDPTEASQLEADAAAIEQAKTGPPGNTQAERAAIADRVAGGDLDPGQVDKELRKLTDPDDAERYAQERSQVLTRAAQQSCRQALRAIADHGEQWRPTLHGLVEWCLDHPLDHDADELWQATVDLHEHLLSLGALPRAEGAATLDYFMARPELAHWWRVDRARTAQQTRREEDTRVFVEIFPQGAPPLSLTVLAKHRQEWGVGLQTAHEVVANLKAIIAAEEEAVEHERQRLTNLARA